ncbi:hypothetical protein FP2506_02944 [Fulvimarina pelagi HTCC2506]|uniref:Uncharacterized protein n=3 Tax=Fulvimarina pelagi TaxID=217511 RepID=Q0G0E4_9HYPH|nr:hypothetical protein FP2506_02944 [Fulvimarina pelagi HTCC2506]
MIETNAIMLGAPFVIGARMMQMAMAGPQPSEKERRETQRMVAEKVAAAQQSALAFNQAMFKAAMDVPLAMMSANPLAKSMDTVASAAIKPYSKRVRANRKRLSK